MIRSFDLRCRHSGDTKSLHVREGDVAGTIHQIVRGEIAFARDANGEPVACSHLVALIHLIGCGRSLGAEGRNGACRSMGREL